MKFSQMSSRRRAHRDVYINLVMMLIKINITSKHMWAHVQYTEIDKMMYTKTKVKDSEESY